MNSTPTPKQWKLLSPLPLLGILLVTVSPGAMARAAEAPAPAPNSVVTDPKDDSLAIEARQFLNIGRLQKAFNAPLDLKVENATPQEIAEQVQKALIARKVHPAPRIEVRDVLPTRLSFDRKGSTAGGVLGSTAALSGARLWFFSDHALIAPMQALTADEMKGVQSGAALNGSLWSPGSPPPVQADMQAQRKVFSAFVAQEIGTLLAKTGRGTATPAANATMLPGTTEAQLPEWPPRVEAINMNQLSPDAQAALQELVIGAKERIQDSHLDMAMPTINLSSYTLTGESQVGVSSRDGGTLVLNFPETGKNMTWTINGTRITTGGGLPPKNTPTAPRPTLPFDPSAGQS